MSMPNRLDVQWVLSFYEISHMERSRKPRSSAYIYCTETAFLLLCKDWRESEMLLEEERRIK